MSETAVVAIGRNEGDRLRVCLESVRGSADHVIYVDSGSTDGSPQLAETLGAHVIALDMSIPFTAARARNAGLAHVLAECPGVKYVQFVDGDCEVVAGWLEAARRTIDENQRVAGVWGRRRERYPEATPYNLICDVDWRLYVKPGEIDAVGGDTMFLVEALREVGGYTDSRIAGEERDLSIRLLRRKWRLMHIAHDVTMHDAAMTRFSQWWKRSIRTGHAFAEISHIYGPECADWGRSVRSLLLFGLLLPLAAVSLALPTLGLSLLLFGVYPLQWFRVYRFVLGEGYSAKAAGYYALNVVLAKFPGAVGVLQYFMNRFRGKDSTIIEYN